MSVGTETFEDIVAAGLGGTDDGAGKTYIDSERFGLVFRVPGWIATAVIVAVALMLQG